MIFTTQEQLFAHFAQEHAPPVDSSNQGALQNVIINKEVKNGVKSAISSVSDTYLGQEDSDPAHHIENSGQVQNPVKSTNLPARLSSDPGNQHASISKGIIVTPPQLQHSCPVCHKVRIILIVNSKLVKAKKGTKEMYDF